MIKKILIANRGEIALRLIRACKEMGIATVAAHSVADEDSMPVRLADESVCIGPASSKASYLNMVSLLSAATITGADAIHPGIGFLAENAQFAEVTKEHGFIFIGPSAEHIRVMGDKITAKQAMIEAGVPVVPGSEGDITSTEQAQKIARQIGYPVLVKAAGGGGGKGMKVAHSDAELEEAIGLASSEAMACFGNPSVYIEKYLSHPRHIEVQILGDKHGNVIHLGERDCSLQRRHQKVLEEAPSPGLTPELRAYIGEVARSAAEKLGYYSAGTFEFLYEDGRFYFIEMNTRLQVEHTISEEITGIDLVKEMIRVAKGEKLGYTQKNVRFHGHAMQCRINAEHAETFIPSPGRITDYVAPGGFGVRVDSHVYAGYTVPAHYDSMVAKLITKADDRAGCLARMKRALQEYAVLGINTTIPLHQRLVKAPAFVAGDYNIHWLEKEFLSEPKAAAPETSAAA
ncbi:MAG: acetyl-CoA carboxylase biotin carboxylase subunit [Alphaproteobacteria bacterium]|nr:acetyl-CoA carboxylase biotin carboxylase subunit [Alphaproteobacteria bacterium]